MTPLSPRRQLALNLRLRDGSSFENYVAGPNREVAERLRRSVQALAATRLSPASWLYLWGEPGCGKTHVLEAACRVAQAAGLASIYIPLAEKDALSPTLLDDVEQTALVCIDDIEHIAGDTIWETALLGLYERVRTQGGMLAVAAATSPMMLGLTLPDLASRLAAGLVYSLHPLSDEDKIVALRLRAERRGMEMGEDVARYLLTRYPRDLHSLFGLLDRLDAATLAAQRRLTIPFLRGLE
jgi:DnaA family protein